MRANIHPKYYEITATCSCGNVMKINSTREQDLGLDVCSSCHPFYTGKHKIVDTAGNIEKYNRRFGSRSRGRSRDDEVSQDEK